jgi:ATP-dependent helicase YprA (DUF1998 family)
MHKAGYTCTSQPAAFQPRQVLDSSWTRMSSRTASPYCPSCWTAREEQHQDSMHLSLQSARFLSSPIGQHVNEACLSTWASTEQHLVSPSSILVSPWPALKASQAARQTAVSFLPSRRTIRIQRMARESYTSSYLSMMSIYKIT